MTAALPIPRPAADPNAWQLVERAQAGDRDAFAEIYRTRYDSVFKFIYCRTANRQVAEDLTADVFLRALTRIGTVEWQGLDIAAWLITIARNLVADHFKSAQVRLAAQYHNSPVVDSTDGWEVLTQYVRQRADEDPMSDPANATVAYLTNVALLKAVEEMPYDDQREVLICRFIKGLSVEETAQEVGKNTGAVKALTYRATQRLGRDEHVQALAGAA